MTAEHVRQDLFLIGKNSVPNSFFQGYCFQGRDYVYGEGGAARYLASKRKTYIPPGEDGCYVTVGIDDNGERFIGTDYWGYKKVFYFSDGDYWAASNSLYRLVSHLHGLKRIRPNYAHLAAIAARGGAMNQLACFETCVQGVRLLPAGAVLRIEGSVPGVVYNKRQAFQGSYEEQLESFIELWLSRFETLLSQPNVEISSDLTGGTDSRAVFGLIMRAIERLGGKSADLGFSYGLGTTGKNRDYEIAGSLCEKYGVVLNPPAIRKRLKLSAQESFMSWKELCLGVYHPIYMPNNAPDGMRVSFSGAGGENNRPFYSKRPNIDTFEDFVTICAGKLRPRWLRWEYERDLWGSMEMMENLYARAADPLILHYQQFRNRFHGGRSPQYSVYFNPLGSHALDAVAYAFGQRELEGSQVNFDIMHNLKSELLDVEFDDIEKAPSVCQRSRLVSVHVRDQPNPGSLYLDSQMSMCSDCSAGAVGERMGLLKEDVDRALVSPFVCEFFDEGILGKAKDTAATAARNRRFDHPNDSQPISAVLSAHSFFSVL